MHKPHRSALAVEVTRDSETRICTHGDADPCAAYDRRLCPRNTECGPIVGGQSVWRLFDATVKAFFVGGFPAAVASTANGTMTTTCESDDGKRHKLDKKITEEGVEAKEFGREVGYEVSSFEEVEVQKKLMKEGKVVENPMFMTEARRKELKRERLKEESTSTCEGEEEIHFFSSFSLLQA